MSSWFEGLFGFAESEAAIHQNIVVRGQTLRSKANGRQFTHGSLTTPTVGELVEHATDRASEIPGTLRVSEVVADAADLHLDPGNAGALFQVASQFNLLEMPGPSVTPAEGITGYVHDHTQGPACAVACAAGTLHRNWFDQSSDDQIDTLADIGELIGNGDADDGRYWRMENGYALLTGVDVSTSQVAASGDALRIGMQTGTEVTAMDAPGHLVTQAYCSAIPLGYSGVAGSSVNNLPRMVLNASYRATLATSVVNAATTGNNRVFLTLVGGGVFANPIPWILDAIEAAVEPWSGADLDVRIVSYGAPNPELQPLLG